MLIFYGCTLGLLNWNEAYVARFITKFDYKSVNIFYKTCRHCKVSFRVTVRDRLSKRINVPTYLPMEPAKRPRRHMIGVIPEMGVISRNTRS